MPREGTGRAFTHPDNANVRAANNSNAQLGQLAFERDGNHEASAPAAKDNDLLDRSWGHGGDSTSSRASLQ